ncbi:unnamed protein product, partial [Polarella glacialis]
MADENLQQALLEAIEASRSSPEELAEAARNGESQTAAVDWEPRQATASSDIPVAENLWPLTVAGFQLQGIHFRIISCEDEWQTICAEVRRVRGLTGPGARLLVAVEGLGVRLAASPALPPLEHDVSTGGGTPKDSCTRWLLAHLRWLQVAPPEDLRDLDRWSAEMPNPRELLSLEVPLAAALRSSASAFVPDLPRGAVADSQDVCCLAVLFGGGPSELDSASELTAADCREPMLLTSARAQQLREKVAAVLRCSAAELRCFEGDPVVRIFGCACEVWYRPKQLDDSGKCQSQEGQFIWPWPSNQFAVAFTGLGTRPPLQRPQGPEDADAARGDTPTAAGQSLTQRLALAAASLRSPGSRGRLQHPRAVRGALKAHGVAARFACALALPVGLSGADGREALDEALGIELLATAAKYTVRHLLSLQQASRSSFPIGVVEDTPSAMETISHTQLESLDSTEALDAPEVFGIGSEPPIPPMRPSSPSARARGPAAPAAAPVVPCPSRALEAEVEHLIGALQVHPEIGRSSVKAPGADRSAAVRLALLQVAFWVRLAAAAWELKVWWPTSTPESTGHLGGKDEEPLVSPRSVGSTASSLQVMAKGSDDEPWEQALAALGRRLLRAAWRVPRSLLRSTSAQLQLELVGNVLRKARLPADSALWAVPLIEIPAIPRAARDLPLAVAQSGAKMTGVVRHAFFRTKGPLSFEDACVQSLDAGLACCRANQGERVDEGLAGESGPLSSADADNHHHNNNSNNKNNYNNNSSNNNSSNSNNNSSPLSSASERLAAELLAGRDLALGGRWLSRPSRGPGWRLRTATGHDGLCKAPGQAVGTPAPSAGLADHKAAKGKKSSAGLCQPGVGRSLALLLQVTRSVVEKDDGAFHQQRAQRARDLLRFAKWLLLAAVRESSPPRGDRDVDGADVAEGGAREQQQSSCDAPEPPNEGVKLEAALAAVSQALSAAAALLGDLAGQCPPELLASLWTLRGYVCEKQGNVENCFVEYLQALAAVDEAWGDPRKSGGRGHPFALLLTWKLGLISYGRGDLKSVDKFADYFRSLVLSFGEDSPFVWGPPALAPEIVSKAGPDFPQSLGDDDSTVARLLWVSEASLWLDDDDGLWAWWRRHDILDFGGEGASAPALLALASGIPPVPSTGVVRVSRERGVASPSSEGIVGPDMQEVRRGTVFAFGSNELGQLGIGPPQTGRKLQQIPTTFPFSTNGPASSVRGSDLAWTGRPVRVMALKESRVQDIACGESHCLALDAEGQLFAWGSDDCHQVGGDAVEAVSSASLHSLDASRPTFTGCPAVHLPRRVFAAEVKQPLRFAAVACGAQFSLALDSSGFVWAWGAGEGGVLGLGVAGLSGRRAPERLG